MLSERAKQNIGTWKRALLRLKPSLPLWMRNMAARTWMRSSASHADKAAHHKIMSVDLKHAAVEMDDRVLGAPNEPPAGPPSV